MTAPGPSAARSRRELPIARGLRAAAGSVRRVALLLVGLFALSGITVVEPGEIALVLRLGRLHGATPAGRIKQPGLLFALPYPIDEVIRVPARREGELLIDDVWRSLADDAARGTIDPLREGYVLSGDQNLIQAKMRVKYRIADPVAFVLHHRSDTQLLRDVVIRSLGRTVAGWDVDATLRQQAEVDGEGRSLAAATLAHAQARLDAVEYGLALSALEFQELHPPRHVVAQFQDVQSAKIAIETAQREAEAFAAREIPMAEAGRNRLVADATTYANALTANATAEVHVFREVLASYQRHPGLTRQRLYHETLEELLGQIGRVQYVAPNTRLMIPGDAPTQTRDQQ